MPRGGAGGRGRAVIEVDKATRRPLRAYGSVSEAARATGTPRTSLERVLRDRGMSSGPSYYRYADDFDPAEEFEGRRRRAVGAWAGGARPARVFDDSAAAARAYRVETVTIRAAIATGRPRFDASLGQDVTLRWL